MSGAGFVLSGSVARPRPGNPALEKVLRQKCGAWSDRGTWFRLHAEKF
jgi:hypothetical protein